eukprot:7841751-Heterocapsa_arctica.AAC.1
MVQPAAVAGPIGMKWAFIIGMEESGHPSKVKKFDESVVVDWDELSWLRPGLRQLQQRAAGRSVWWRTP